MPKLITDAAETTINALIYATEHTPDVFHEVPLFFKQFPPEIHIVLCRRDMFPDTFSFSIFLLCHVQVSKQNKVCEPQSSNRS